MKLVVIVFCLLSERYLIHALSYQRFSWFGDYAAFINQKIENNSYFNNPWVKLAALIVPLTLITSVVYLIFSPLILGLGGLIISLLIFFYCLGPHNPFYPINSSDSEKANIADYFALVNSQLFAVLFWYALGGPIVVLIYRLFSLSKDIISVQQQATQVVEILEWIPARITALLFLLVGNFQRGFTTLMHYMLAGPDSNNELLRECGLQAVRINDVDDISLPTAEALVEQATIVLVVFIALFTLVAWL